MTVKFSLVVAAVLTVVVHHLMSRRPAIAQAPRPGLGVRIRRWFDAAAIAVIGTLVIFGAIHWIGVLSRGHA